MQITFWKDENENRTTQKDKGKSTGNSKGEDEA